MSIECFRWVIEHSPSKGADRLVLLMIAYHANESGGESWPSIETIKAETNLSRRAVCYSIDALVVCGQLEMTVGGGRGHSNSYRVAMGKGANHDINSAAVAPFPQTVQTETVQSTTETVQSTTLKGATFAPEPSSIVIEPTEEEENTERAREVPQKLAAFDAILRDSGNGHYDPSPAFYSKVATKYAILDLEEEALKAVCWLRGERAKKLKRTCSTAFLLNWLKHAMEDRDAKAGRGAGDSGAGGAVNRPIEVGPGAVSPFAKYGGATGQS